MKFYNSLYEMKIAWYADEVSFNQKVILHRLTAKIHGTVEYMVCNSNQCVPHQELFAISIRPH